jgi:putative methionine-R-sulfoxide reductase with GAF domain
MESPHGASPADSTPENLGIPRERRRARRHKVFTPAYANLSGSAQGAVLELNEILNISESGMCIQASAPMKVNRLLPLGIDLSETGVQIRTVGHVVWSDPSGRTGIRFPDMAAPSLAQLKDWLAANARVGSAASLEGTTAPDDRDDLARRPVQAKPTAASGYTSLVTEWAEIDKEVDLCGPDLEPALHLIAQRALTLTWASGTAIALINKLNPAEMVCRARAGTDSPEMGARLEAGSGFSGQCVRTATTLKCDDSEYDSRVDRKSCRGLGIRSIVACPVKRKDEVIGILEVFSPEPAAFWENDITILERLTGIIEKAVRRAEHVRADVLAFPLSGESVPNTKASLFPSSESQGLFPAPVPLSRKILLLLTAIVCTTAVVWLAAPWMATWIPKLDSATSGVASASPAEAKANVPHQSYAGKDIKDLRKFAAQGNADAEYALGKRYATGDGVRQDYREAMRWFLPAAELGNVPAQAKVATCYWAGKGVPRDYSKAYFWALLAEAGGDKDAAFYRTDSGNYLSQAQSNVEHIAAENWLHTHHVGKALP